jgi:uncharacterized protein YjiS (DUF1127 family)
MKGTNPTLPFGAFVPTNGWPTVPTISQMAATSRQRRELRSLDPHILADIGVTATEAAAETKRPVWDVPGYWRR